MDEQRKSLERPLFCSRLLKGFRRIFLEGLYVHMYACMAITYSSKSIDQPSEVANPARGQLNWEINISLSTFAA